MVLLIEDNAEIAQLTQLLLTASGHDVAVASDGPGALQIIEREVPRLVVLDISMPGMSGLEVLDRLKSNPVTAGVPVLIFTAGTIPATEQAAHRLGANGLVLKSADPSLLIARVNELVQRSPVA